MSRNSPSPPDEKVVRRLIFIAGLPYEVEGTEEDIRGFVEDVERYLEG